jgi:hypothetical protein
MIGWGSEWYPGDKDGGKIQTIKELMAYTPSAKDGGVDLDLAGETIESNWDSVVDK